MALDKECKERQYDSPLKTPVCSIEKQPAATLCPPSPLHLRETVRGRQNQHVCRLTFHNPAGVMVFPQASIVEADPAFKTESNRWLFCLRAGGAGQFRSVCTATITLLKRQKPPFTRKQPMDQDAAMQSVGTGTPRGRL